MIQDKTMALTVLCLSILSLLAVSGAVVIDLNSDNFDQVSRMIHGD